MAMTELIRRFPDAAANARGAFTARVMARTLGDGGWEGWLEFAPLGAGDETSCLTGTETRQRDRVAMQRWASGLTPIYVEGALARARSHDPEKGPSELMATLQEIVAALDRGIPQVERASEPHIAAEAKRLRAAAAQRIAALRLAAT
jgi:hypothetical protein